MDNKEIIEFLKKIELFRGLTDDEYQMLMCCVEVKTYRAYQFLFRENGRRENIFIIYEGEVELFKSNPYGVEMKLTYFSKGDFLGEGSWDTETPHSTSARTLAPTTVLTLANEVFNKNATTTLKIFSNITRVISRRMRHANSRMINPAAQYESGRTRNEHDLLGNRDVPYEYYYGIQTLRALENFNISGVALNFFPMLIDALAMVKEAAAEANCELGLMDERVKDAIVAACQEIVNGKYHNHFVVDLIQGGAGTSTNMNANEVIANRALELMGYEKGQYEHCHPNNHVNLSQSTNDAYPTAVKIALIHSNEKLVDVLKSLIESFQAKARDFAHVIKMGRTQLQDAVPMTLGQEFEAYASTLSEEVERLNQNAKLFLEVNMGATAIGTGINSEPEYAEKVMNHLRRITKLDLNLASNLVEATQDTGAFVIYSSAVKRLSIKLSKICNDLRLLSSGPRTGLNEINLPPMQPGSSIMPGKVNPVIPEVVNQIAFKVIGNDLTVTMAAEGGQLELNVFEPVIVQSIFESIEMLKNGMNTLKYRCIDGITANEEHCRNQVHNSIGLVTALNPIIGYEKSTVIAKEAMETGKSVYELVLEHNILTKEQLEKILAPENMIKPGKITL
ncbi:MAG: aspartate ammonia-lyase [Bacteroidales bacterium]|jgi:aspartate ammonia-lyase|nr:aspartate ammonia-lyase [Bacteroidales bacterium]OQC65187.1 MAG: Aspartate ammonia-lyase [Bacteroidetes bacterium ADurb.Bin008]